MYFGLEMGKKRMYKALDASAGQNVIKLRVNFHLAADSYISCTQTGRRSRGESRVAYVEEEKAISSSFFKITY